MLAAWKVTKCGPQRPKASLRRSEKLGAAGASLVRRSSAPAGGAEDAALGSTAECGQADFLTIEG